MAEETEIHFGQFVVRKSEAGKWPVLGRGGMGVTYKAFDTSLHRDVALKVISQQLLDDPHMKKMFLREARSAATLTHRNVAQVYQVGADEETWYAMEFIPGQTTEQMLQQRRKEGHSSLELYHALDIGLQTVRALTAAEKEHLVHRDIKPSNIMVMMEDDEYVVKLIDFGLAKTLKPSQDASVFVSRAGFMGTPMFASPEQITDKEIDIRSDIYALGATLWFMIEGRPPFESENQFQLYNQQLNDPPPVERLKEAQIPDCVIGLLQHMLEKKPDDRPQSARDLFGMFRACIEELPPEARIDLTESRMHTHPPLRPTQPLPQEPTVTPEEPAVAPDKAEAIEATTILPDDSVLPDASAQESAAHPEVPGAQIPPTVDSVPSALPTDEDDEEPTRVDTKPSQDSSEVASHPESDGGAEIEQELSDMPTIAEPTIVTPEDTEPPTNPWMESEPPTNPLMESEPPTRAADGQEEEPPTRAASDKSYESRRARPIVMIASLLVAVLVLGGASFAYTKIKAAKAGTGTVATKRPPTAPPENPPEQPPEPPPISIPTEPPPPRPAGFDERLVELKALQTQGKPAAALVGLMQLADEAQGENASREARTAVQEILSTWHQNPDALKPREYATVRPQLDRLAREDDPQALILLSRITATTAPAESIQHLRKAAGVLESLGQLGPALDALLQAKKIAGAGPDQIAIVMALDHVIETGNNLSADDLTRAAEAGSLPAMLQLAKSLQRSDEPAAFTWYKGYAEQMAASQRWPEALGVYVELLEQPSRTAFATARLNNLFKDWQKVDGPALATLALSRSAIEAAAKTDPPLPEAMRVLARMDQAANPQQAASWLRQAHDQFSADQQWDRQIDTLLYMHRSSPDNHSYVKDRFAGLAQTLGELPAAAFTRWRPLLEEAARTDSAPILMLLGERLRGVDDTAAFVHYKKAATWSADAAMIAGDLSAEGIGTPRDERQASRYYKEAGEAFDRAGKIPERFKAYLKMYSKATGSERLEAQQVLVEMSERFRTAEPPYDVDAFVNTIPHLTRFAEMDHLPTMRLLGERLIESDIDTAYTWMQRVAAANVREEDWGPALDNWIFMHNFFPKQKTNIAADIKTHLHPLLDDVHHNVLEADKINVLLPKIKILAEQDELSAVELLYGYHHATGDHLAGVKHLRRLAPNSTFAQIQLGLHMRFGQGVDANGAEALKLIQQAHAAGDPDAIVPLAECYYQAVGTETNMPEAIKLIQAAVKLDYAKAKYMLSSLYNEGVENLLPKDPTKAFKLLEEAAIKQQYGPAYATLGAMYINRYPAGPKALTESQPKEAILTWEAGVKADGDERCSGFLFTMGQMLLKGSSLIATDPVEGRRLIQLAADHGEASAIEWLKKNPSGALQ